MGYTKHVPGINTIRKRNQARWTSVVRKIHQWIYSWMRPGYCLDEDEYKISRFLLKQFICSPGVLVAAEGHSLLIIRILQWLDGCVLVYDDQFLFYLRKTILHLYVAMSTGHEVFHSL